MRLQTIQEYQKAAFVITRDQAVEIAWALEKVLPFLPDGLDPETTIQLYNLQSALNEALRPKE